MTAYSSVAIFLFSAIALVVPSGFSLGAVLLLAGGLTTLWRQTWPELRRHDRIIIIVLFLYFAANVVVNLIHAAPLREYDAPLRFLLAIPALLLLRACPPHPAFLWSGLAVGAIGAGFYAGWQTLILSHDRAAGDTNPIQYGNISLILGVLCLAGIQWSLTQRRAKLWIAFLVAGVTMGILGSMFTGSRGSWLSLPFVFLVLYACYRRSIKKRYVIGGLASAVAVCITLYTIPQTEIKARVQLAITETQEYLRSDDAGTSVGARLEMWRMGAMIFPSHPWLGWGKEGYMKRTDELIKAGTVHPIVGDHNHLHNEYLDALVKRGIPGLIAVLMLYLVPFRLFTLHFSRAAPGAQPYAVAGMLLSVCYIVFGLTQAFLTHNNGVMILAFMFVILWSIMRNHEPAEATSGKE